MNDQNLDLSAIGARSLWLSEALLRNARTLEPVRCQECGDVVVRQPIPRSRSFKHNEFATDSKCSGHLDLAEGPMMNAFWPLPAHFASDDMDGLRHATEVAARLIDYETCLVFVHALDRWGFGLTGGGQDLSWEIAASYLALGFAPPVELGPLPKMAVRPSEARVAIARGMLTSLDAMRLRLVLRAEEQREDVDTLARALARTRSAT